jgi:hypothetical protein
MKRKVVWSLLTLIVLVGASLKYTQSASSSSITKYTSVRRAVRETSSPMMMFVTTLDVDRTDDTAAATACTPAANDCSLRGAIIAANTDLSATPVVINLQAATTYNLTLSNANQENAAATGDLDVTTFRHSVTIVGGGSSGPSASVIDASGLNTGNNRDRVFDIRSSGANVTLQDLVIQNGVAADDGTNNASTNPNAQNTHRFGGGILNNGGSVTLTNVAVNSCQTVGKGDTIINNHNTLDASGGGLASLTTTGSVVVTGSTFSNDEATGGNGGNFNNGAGSNAKGGGIYFEGGVMSVSLSRFDSTAANGGDGGSVDQNGMANGGSGGFAQGGGIWVGGGSVSISNTTFESTAAVAGNSGTGGNGSNPGGAADGGGLFVGSGGVTISNSTFHLSGATGGNGGNAFGTSCVGAHNAGDGGGARGGAIFANAGSLIVNTATFANNFAMGGNGGNGGQTDGGLNCGMHGAGGLAYGGAIANNFASTNVKHATISLNNAQAGNTGINQGGANKPPRLVAEGTGGGIRVGIASVSLQNTIIAGNSAANGAGDTTGAPTPGGNVDGTVNSNGYNLLGNSAEASGFTGTGDQTGANPMLAALADNGGPTQTMALSPGSSAIDAGVAAGATTDQRGLPRTVDDPGVVNAATSDGTDIGAFEGAPSCNLTCPSNMTVSNDPGECGAVVNYTASGTGCGTVTCDHPSGSFFAVGDTTVTCTSSTGPSCSFKVTVNDTEAPTISLNGANPLTVECHTSFTDPGATAVDGCAGSFAASASGTVNVNVPGTYLITYTASDPSGNSATPQIRTVNVVDTTAPTITLNGNTPSLWPPNHRYHTFNVTDFVTGVTDGCDTSLGTGSVVISQVTSDEQENSTGDGNTFNDIVIAGDCKSVQLRAERDGAGDGRVYTITFKVRDASGNVATATVKVLVPLNQANGPATDSGPHYTVLGDCP